MLSHFAGAVKQGKQTAVFQQEEPTIIEVSHTVIEQRIGKDISETDIKDILSRLGFALHTKKDVYTVTVPSWRDTGDISIAPDIIEEIARHVGYETVPTIPLPGPLGLVQVHAHDTLTMKISSFFSGK